MDNLYVFSKEILKFTVATKSNGITTPEGVLQRRFEKRVVFHPTSSRPGKNWPWEKFLELAKRLKLEGFDPAFILTEEERKGRDFQGIQAPAFKSLSEKAAFICESGWMIGNDSGIGHLASCLGLPTLTLCRSQQAARFWRPAWALGKVLTPPAWIPNLKGLRLRDQHWQKWISVKKALESFNQLK